MHLLHKFLNPAQQKSNQMMGVNAGNKKENDHLATSTAATSTATTPAATSTAAAPSTTTRRGVVISCSRPSTSTRLCLEDTNADQNDAEKREEDKHSDADALN